MPDRQDDDRRLGQEIMAASHVIDLRESADETGALIREILKPLPTLPLDPAARERVLAVALLAKDDAAKRFLSLVAMGM